MTIFEYNFVIKTENKVFEPYTVKEELGTGGFATVRKAEYRGIDDYQFAMKSMKKKVEGLDMKPCIINELDILNTLDHPNIANFNECYEDDTYIHAILEFSPGKSLAQLFTEIQERMPTLDLMKIFYQIVKTAAYLKKIEIVHRDYKPPNIMIYKTDKYELLGYQIQLLDFGFARKLHNKTIKEVDMSKEIIMGSPHYIAPEALISSYGFPSDVWSIGVMLYFAIALRHPFEEDNEDDLFKSIKLDRVKFEPESEWKDISPDLIDLIEQMLTKDPDRRITIEKVFKHPAFAEVHSIVKSSCLSSAEIEQLSRYFRLSPIQRKFLKYSTKFIPPKEKLPY